jgi:Cys-rich protein (TIGR01571 family)
MSGEFQHGLFGCFDNCCLCIVTYLVPCYTAGKVAEKVGESCLLHGCMLLFCPCISLFCMCSIRGKVRTARKIAGSSLGDFCAHLFCTPCALCQEGMEVNAFDQTMAAVEEGQEMTRE